MFNTNNYGYNPYGRYMPVQPMQQPIEQPIQPLIPKQTLNGKLVDSIETAKSSEYILDGSVSYFALTDGSAILTKQLQTDGTSKIVVFKPIEEQKEENRYITQEDMKKALESIDLSELEDIRDDIKDLRQEIKDIKKKKKDE